MIFLFTDIEGSTERWETRTEAMRDAVRRHDDLMRDAMETNGGDVFKTVGDAFCVTFPSAGQALQAALQAQRELRAHDWNAVDGLRVRMALHGGEADERGGDYFGTAVNRVARLLSAGHGGQILVSDVAAAALDDPLPDGVALRHLGTFQLKDLRAPERVYQVVARDLPADFKPLRTLEAVPNNLPRQTSGFVGREDDIAHIRELMRESTLVTIAGAGGVGKTRIALQCAADGLDREKDGAWFIDLAQISDPALVASTMLGALHVKDTEGDALDALVAYLVDREVLLLPDNCEHVVEEAARIIRAVRQRCPRVTVLATSREPLHLEGERVYRLPPLDDVDALRLFVQRAQAASQHFALGDDNARAIETICRQLDGIPLAIELAAARVNVLSPEELSHRLAERFRLLKGATRGALPRQQTLRALIDWSHDLLGDEEKTLFRRLAAFSGGCTFEAASVVCADRMVEGDDVLDVLSSLVDKSLVVAGIDETNRRFTLLESIRDYARERLDQAEETPRVTALHAAYFAERAGELYAQWDRNPSASAVKPMLPEIANVRAALQWALADGGDPQLGARLAADSGPLFIQLSLLGEGAEWCTRALTTDGIAPPVRARLEYMRSMFYNNQALVGPALAAAESALAAFLCTDDERGTVRALSQVAQQYARAGRFDDAKPKANEAIDRARATGDARLLASVTRRCAFSLPPSEIEHARSQFSGAAAILKAAHAGDEAAQVLEWWAEAEAAAGCFDRAADLAIQALSDADETGRMYLTSNIAGYMLAAGEFERAEPFTREALPLAERARHPLLIAIGLAYYSALRAREDARDGARLFGYARAQMAAAKWKGIASDQCARDNILKDLSARVDGDALFALLAEGAAWDERQALAHAQVASSEPSPSSVVPSR